MVRARQVVIVSAGHVEVREVELPDPEPNQILVAAEYSAISAGTELAVYTGTHQWLKDPAMKEWKFPFRSGYSAAGRVLKVGRDFPGGFREGDRVSFPGNHASAELLTLGQERCRVWRLPEGLSSELAACACIARYGLGAAIRVGITLARSVAVLGLGIIGQFALRCFLAAGAAPVIGIDTVQRRREAAQAAGADHVIDPNAGDLRQQVQAVLGTRGAEIVVDATGVPAAVPTAMSLACDGGQVVIVGSPRGVASNVNFYDDLHRRYLEVTGAHGNMLFEPAHTRIPGHWDIDKAQNWLLHHLACRRLNLEGLITHVVTPEEVGQAYEGLLHDKEHYLGVLVKWV
ncbi:MAG: zinc-binding alcohol dehydrogenase [Thermogemmata sp.]|jgi:2-desacetyl-2-hydroxyethyl bacteriochlorophyllide A dehydrogenase|uniref:Zinc-binding alcohol dehydrogenase n=1 Tax=Thermogemmata fonticola TaxID=2755323 RepID=A0A7V9AD68_9BACT|nr:zinc-binding alcohol dehydrogenase [Thermogemmata fonticola]MBA2227708.1 zinc-binding alcohol dehydrogenase [Thermogemmata fonticola]